MCASSYRSTVSVKKAQPCEESNEKDKHQDAYSPSRSLCPSVQKETLRSQRCNTTTQRQHETNERTNQQTNKQQQQTNKQQQHGRRRRRRLRLLRELHIRTHTKTGREERENRPLLCAVLCRVRNGPRYPKDTWKK